MFIAGSWDAQGAALDSSLHVWRMLGQGGGHGRGRKGSWGCWSSGEVRTLDLLGATIARRCGLVSSPVLRRFPQRDEDSVESLLSVSSSSSPSSCLPSCGALGSLWLAQDLTKHTQVIVSQHEGKFCLNWILLWGNFVTIIKKMFMAKQCDRNRRKIQNIKRNAYVFVL